MYRPVLLVGSIFLILALAPGPAAAAPPAAKLEVVAMFRGPMPTGVTVSHQGRIFVCYPRWGDKIDFTVAELKGDQATAFPDASINRVPLGAKMLTKQPNTLISVQSVVVDPKDRLWLLDTGSINFGRVSYGGPKLVGVDLTRNEVFKTILFPQDVALPTTYLNDVRFDLGKGSQGTAYITDSSTTGANGIIVVDLATGKSWRRLHDHPSTKPTPKFNPIAEDRPVLQRPRLGKAHPWTIGSDGIAISKDGKRLFYCPLSSNELYSVDAEALRDAGMLEEKVAATVKDLGKRSFGSDGLESDAEGRLYLTDYVHNAIQRRSEKGDYEILVQDPRMLWPDTLSLATDGYLYFTANQLHRQPNFHEGKDLRVKPYYLFRFKVDAKPVLLSGSK